MPPRAAAVGAAVALFLLAGCAVAPLRLRVAAAPWENALDGAPLRVLLRFGEEGIRASAPGGLRLMGADGSDLGEIPSLGRARLGAHDGRLTFNGVALDASAARIEALRTGDTVRVEGRRYRGRLLVEAVGSRLALVNVVGLEGYLKGVLPSEISASGPAEALKAQAVAARSFALAEMQDSPGKAWDLDNSADSQVYGGESAETPATDAAVLATRGEVLTWQGSVIRAYFHSNSGGHTADAAEVWGGDCPPYLRGVPDPWSTGGKHAVWTVALPLPRAQALLRNAGLWTGTLADIVPRDRSDSGRWTRVDLVGASGRDKTVGADAFRLALGADRVRSTRFRVRLEGGAFVFEGRGWGHGVGLSQEGALAMARDGWDYQDILSFYYPGTGMALLDESR